MSRCISPGIRFQFRRDHPLRRATRPEMRYHAEVQTRMMSYMRLFQGALASRNFRLLLGCDVIAGIGNAVALVAIPFAVFAIGGSVADIGYVAAAMLLPMVPF